MTFTPDLTDDFMPSRPSKPAAQEPTVEENTIEQKWDAAVSFYKKHAGTSEYNRRIKSKFTDILKDKNFAPTYTQLKEFYAHGNGEIDIYQIFSEALIKRATDHNIDLTQNDGEFIVLLAKHGKRFSIGEALQTSNNWNGETIKTAINIAVEGNKAGTTASLVQNCPISHLPILCDTYFKYRNTNIAEKLQEEIVKRISQTYNSIEKLYDLKQTANHSLQTFIQFYAEHKLKSQWQKPNDQEASFHVESHGTSITRLFNFKAEHVHITTQSKNGLVADITTFNDYQGDNEIMEAYKFLSIASQHPPEAPRLKTRKPKIMPPSKKL